MQTTIITTETSQFVFMARSMGCHWDVRAYGKTASGSLKLLGSTYIDGAEVPSEERVSTAGCDWYHEHRHDLCKRYAA